MGSSTSLRAITHRLTTTPVEDLPHVAPYVAASLSDCSDIISSPQAKKTANSDDNDALLVNKLKARVASLVQDRTPQGRWTGVVLVKATIEAGQWEILHECAPWVRALLSILSVRVNSIGNWVYREKDIYVLTNIWPETGPDIHKTAVYYNIDSHFSFDIPISNIGPGNNDAEFADLRHSSAESGHRETTERRAVAVKRATASGNRSVGIHRTHQSAPDDISALLQPATNPAAADRGLVQPQLFPILRDHPSRANPFCVLA